MKAIKHVGVGLAAGLLLSLPLGAEEATLSDWDIGKVQCGDESLAEDLKGKVVVIEYWGTR